MGCGTSIELQVSDNPVSMKQTVSLPSTSKHTNEGNRLDKGINKQSDQHAQVEDPVQNFFLVWLDACLDESKEDFRNSISKLHLTIDAIEKFRDTNECIKYIANCENKKIFLVVSGKLTSYVVPLMHDKIQVYAIYIFCYDKSKYEQWKTEKWPKVRGVYTNMDLICSELRLEARACEDDTKITGQIESSFKYSMLLKNIVLTISFDLKREIPALVEEAREKYKNNPEQLKSINKFVDEYDGDIDSNNPVRWYTAECFTYKMLNKALGQLDFKILLKTGFFMQDLHENIQQLYKKQFNDKGKPFPETVFRGQTMTQEDFDSKVQQDKLMSYNNFLSTSEVRDVAIGFIKRKLEGEKNKIGVLFIITIDLSVESALYARIAEFSEYTDEKEILFSTHTVFRVRQIREIHEHGINIQQVKLTLVSEKDDKELNDLTESMRHSIIGTGWQPKGCLFREMQENENVDQICTMLLEQATDDTYRSYCYNQLGFIRLLQEQYTEALEFYQKTLHIQEQTLSENDPSLATSYNNIAEVYLDMRDYSKALEFYKKARKIWEIAAPPDHRDLASCYNKIGLMYLEMDDVSTSLEFYEKALQIREKILPPNHPDLSCDCQMIADIYYGTDDYSKALEFYEKSVKIDEKALPPDHLDLATTYHRIGQVYNSMGDYCKALEFYEKARKIWEIPLSPGRSSLSASYENIAGVYYDMGDYSKALEFLEKAKKIKLQDYPPDHPFITIINNGIATVKEKL
jgi:tetratricopeptide (TPR) repeat protein